MKQLGFILFLLAFTLSGFSQLNQNDSLIAAVITVDKDPRIDMLGKKMAEYNEALASRPSGGIRSGRGYRLMMLSTTNRQDALNVRSRLLQLYPDQKVYMTFQSPYIKVKFGNFADKHEAEQYRRQLSSSGIVNNNIYLVPETVELKIEKNGSED